MQIERTTDLQNPVNPSESLELPVTKPKEAEVHPQKDILPGDSTLTKAEKVERHGLGALEDRFYGDLTDSATKRLKLDHASSTIGTETVKLDTPRQKGVAAIKAE